MIDFDYLSKGLNALARAHLMGPMAGHLGAAVVAGYFLGEQRPELDEAVYSGIEGDLERVIRGESLFGAKMSKGKSAIKDSDLFEPFAKQRADESLIDGIAEALEKNISKPRQSGHNVIFASIAIRALKEHPEFATPSITDGIRKLIARFDGVHPGSGNYGKSKGRVSGDKINLTVEADQPPPYKSISEMATTVLEEIIHQDPKVHRQGYGGLVHINNHASAITDLAQYGYPELVPAALTSHHRHLCLWRSLPNLIDELGPMKSSAHDPHSAGYWNSGKVRYDSALLTHRVKTMYGFDELVEVVEDETRRELAYRSLRHLL